MKFTINIPFAEYPLNVAKTVVLAPFRAVKAAETYVAQETTKQVVKAVLSSDNGQTMLAEALIQGMKNSNLKEKN